MEDPCIKCDIVGERNSFLKHYQYQLSEILKKPTSNPPFKDAKETLHEDIANAREITAREQVGNGLKASEQRFRRLSEASFEAIAIHKDGVILDFNQKLLEMFGYTSEEISQINGLELVTPEDRETARDHIASGYEEPYEVMGMKKDGTRFPIEMQFKQSQMDGQAVRIGAIKDLSNHKEMERQIAESEKRYRELYDNSPIALYRTRISDGKLLECNQALVELLGYDNKEDYMATNSSLSSYVHSDDRTYLLEKLEKEKRVEGFQFQVKQKNWEPLWIEMTAEMFPEQGYLEGAMQDITASKLLSKAEKKILRQVIEGKSNKEIAYASKRSTRTIEDHRSHIMQKLHADNLPELIRKAKSLRD